MKNILIILFSFLALTGCNNWLDVQPVDKNLEETQFATEENIYSALNGLYIGMASEHLYGGKLTMTDIEHLSHYYYSPTTLVNNAAFSGYYYLQNYGYSDTDVEARFSNVWKQAYSLILGCNKFILNVSEGNVLSEKNKNIVLGEAYAMRAFLHFDLFRLFGPVSPELSAETTIPYNESSVMQRHSPLTAAEIYAKLMGDLDKAEELLADDPILEFGIVKFNDGVVSGMSSAQKFNVCLRNHRLNLLAVETLRARVLLYWGQRQEAATIASDVITQLEGKLKWTDLYTSTGNHPHITTNSDYIFHSELLFAIENSSLYSSWQTYTGGSRLHSSYAVHSSHLITNIFKTNTDSWTGNSDIRTRQWVVNSDLGASYYVSRRFNDLEILEEDEFFNLIKYIQPLMRMSELYYIVAENMIHQDLLQPAMDILNEVSAARNKKESEELVNATREELLDFLEAEYYREFYAEGQTFFYMKRNARTQMFRSDGAPGYNAMDLKNYVVPLPLDEISN